MPCFGTTDRTYNNACEMTRQTGATLIEVPIGEAVNVHFRDIGHDPDVHDVTYEMHRQESGLRCLWILRIGKPVW